MEDKKKRKKNEDSSNSDRVTLKKEIGLLSACAIIIGECVTAFVIRAQLTESVSKWWILRQGKNWRENVTEAYNVADVQLLFLCQG